MPRFPPTPPSKPNCSCAATATAAACCNASCPKPIAGGDGVLHLDHNAAEAKRNQALGRQHHHAHLYRTVSAAEAGQIAGTPISQSALYWPQGAVVELPCRCTPCSTIPDHPAYPHTAFIRHSQWPWLASPHACRPVSRQPHVYRTGAHSPQMADCNVAALPWRLIRGQTSSPPPAPNRPNCAAPFPPPATSALISARLHCYGATFLPQQRTSDWQMAF